MATKHLVEAIVSAARDEGMCADFAEQFRSRVEAILADQEIVPMRTVSATAAARLVREEFSNCSTGSMQWTRRTGYYNTKGHAVNAFNGALQTYGLCLDRDDLADFHGNDGRKIIDVHDESKHCVGRAVFTWHRMESGCYEFIGYLA